MTLRLFLIFPYFFLLLLIFLSCPFLRSSQHFDLSPNRTSPLWIIRREPFMGKHTPHTTQWRLGIIIHLIFAFSILHSSFQIATSSLFFFLLGCSFQISLMKSWVQSYLSLHIFSASQKVLQSAELTIQTAIHGASIFTEICPLNVSPTDLSKCYTIHN